MDKLTKNFGFQENYVKVYRYNREEKDFYEIQLLHEKALMQDNVYDIVVSDDYNNKESLTEFMKRNGCVLIKTYRTDIIPELHITHMIYVPYPLRDVTEEIREKCPFLYHNTVTQNVKSIFQKGLVPNMRNLNKDGIIYSPRIYFFTDYYDACDNMDMMESFYPTAHYTMLQIDVSQLDDDIRFYYDPLVDKERAVYTETEIPVSAITKRKETRESI